MAFKGGPYPGKVFGDQRGGVVPPLPSLSPAARYRYQKVWDDARGRVARDALGETQGERVTCGEVTVVLERKDQLFDREVVGKCSLALIESRELVKAVVEAFMIRPWHCAAWATAGEPGQVFLTERAQTTRLRLALISE